MFNHWNILVVGAGTMGHGIALEFAVHGFNTALVDVSQEKLDAACKKIGEDLDVLIQFGEITKETADKARKRITYSYKLEDVAVKADFVSEAVFESPDAKRPIYEKLGMLCPAHCILSSSTSALNIYDIASVPNPERLIIAHFFNPPHIMPLVEVVKGPETSDATVDTVMALLTQIGKSPALIKQYIPGFIINRMSAAIARETSFLVSQGLATPDDIESAICSTFGLRYPFEGPLRLQDYVGWDVVLDVSKTTWAALCNTGDTNPLAAQLVAQGSLGVKVGKGLWDYSNANIAEMQKKRVSNILKMRQAVKALNEA